MEVYEAIKKRRSVRKFIQDRKIDRKVFERLIEAARLAPSASNIQPVKYVIADDEKLAEEIFRHVRWAAYVAPHRTPKEGERPVAFIALCADLGLRKDGYQLDIGAAVQNIFLAATAEGLGTCWIGSLNRDEISRLLNLPDNLFLNTLIAVGYPAESPVYEDENGSVKYYLDENDVLHVPKRKLSDILYWNKADKP